MCSICTQLKPALWLCCRVGIRPIEFLQTFMTDLYYKIESYEYQLLDLMENVLSQFNAHRKRDRNTFLNV